MSQPESIPLDPGPAPPGAAARAEIQAAESGPWRIDLLKALPALKWLVTRRWFQFAVVLPNLLFFALFLMAGLFGTPVGNRNVIIIVVWILWWFLLISAMVPFLSRIWCTVCPFPFFGEWAQRSSLVRVLSKPSGAARSREAPAAEAPKGGTYVGRNRYRGLNRRWPKRLSNIWLQNVGFLALCTFSAHFLTRPVVSVGVLGALFVTATVLHLVYRQRAFCNYVCPVSGFLSLYSMTSMTEIRRKSAEVCAECKDKGCLAGNEHGWGCPWLMYPSKMDRNNYCGMCMECVKTCPHDNMTLNLRPFCSDTKLKGYDEAWKAFIMLALALAYSVIYLGPWGTLKDWANVATTRDWVGFGLYAAGLWGGALVVLPGIYAAAVWLGRRLAGPGGPSARETFLGFVYPVVPLGLLVWVAFSLPLILVNGSYILMIASDPFGWGWDLFGTAHVAWTPVVPHWTPWIQVPLLLVGLGYALATGWRRALSLYGPRALRAFAPVAVLLTGLVEAFLWLYVG